MMVRLQSSLILMKLCAKIDTIMGYIVRKLLFLFIRICDIFNITIQGALE